MIRATPPKACAEDAPTDFSVRLYRNSAGILSYVKGFLCKMTENMSADSVQSRKAGFVRCCPNVMPGKDKPELSGKYRIMTILTRSEVGSLRKIADNGEQILLDSERISICYAVAVEVNVAVQFALSSDMICVTAVSAEFAWVGE